MVAILMLTLLAGPAASERMKRPMKVHRVAEVGLEIWVEHTPRWTGELKKVRDKAVYVVSSPENNHPPVVMNYLTIPEAATIPRDEMKDVVSGAIRTAAANYGHRQPESVAVRPSRHGILEGYEARFPGTVGGTKVDVQVFVGAAPGKPLVAMHVYTLRGKLDHISENIRRAWDNVKYLD